MKELRAFKQLYQELTDRYNQIGYQEEYFEDEHIAEDCSLQRLMKSYERQSKFMPIVHDMNKDAINLGFDLLINMERNLIKLERTK